VAASNRWTAEVSFLERREGRSLSVRTGRAAKRDFEGRDGRGSGREGTMGELENGV
jgi:hypothetical protein